MSNTKRVGKSKSNPKGEESASRPIRTEKEIQMEILVLTLELMSVQSGTSKEEIIDRCLERSKKDEHPKRSDQ